MQITPKIVNVNLGLMGHVDCGKTTLAKALSSSTGTACFDKSPQSQSRGITLDLGFSSFNLSNSQQVTIVDCPGHSSLIRTVLCGAQIIDMILLVIDVNKGIQAQTAECLMIAEILANRLIFVLNKVDMVGDEGRVSMMASKLRTVLKGGKFCGSPVVAVSAKSGAGIEELRSEIDEMLVRSPITRDSTGEFVFAVDHCFPIKGQGTVLTGTVLSGQISVNQSIEIPHLKISRKIKSIQSFRRTVNSLESGDRAGICVTSLESESIERTLITASTSTSTSTSTPLKFASVLVVEATRIKYFRSKLVSKSKIHISILNETVLARRIIFAKKTAMGYEYLEEMPEDKESEAEGLFYVIIELEDAIPCILEHIVIGSKLDLTQKCRLVFHGKLKSVSDTISTFKIYKIKERSAVVDRIVDEKRIIARDFGKRREKDVKSNVGSFIGMNIELCKTADNVLECENEEQAVISTGRIDSLFGSSGKFNVIFPNGHGVLPPLSQYKLRLRFGKVLFNGGGNNTSEKLCMV